MREGLKSWIRFATEAMLSDITKGSLPGGGNNQEDENTDMPPAPPGDAVDAELDDNIDDLKNCMEDSLQKRFLDAEGSGAKVDIDNQAEHDIWTA